MLEKLNKNELIILGIIMGCLSVMILCMVGFIYIKDYIRGGMIFFMFIALYFLLKKPIKQIIKLKK